MEKLIIHVERCIQNFQEIGKPQSAGDLMQARVFFSIEHNKKVTPGLHVDVLLTHEAKFNRPDDSPIEVGKPQGGYKGPFNHAAFRDGIDRYYRKFVCGPDASGIQITGGNGIIMTNNEFCLPWAFAIEVRDQGGGW